MSRDDEYSLVNAQLLRDRRQQRQSSPDSDPAELKRKLRERDEADNDKRDQRLSTLEASVDTIEKTIVEFKAMVRAWLMATTAVWSIVAIGLTIVLKFWPGGK